MVRPAPLRRVAFGLELVAELLVLVLEHLVLLLELARRGSVGVADRRPGVRWSRRNCTGAPGRADATGTAPPGAPRPDGDLPARTRRWPPSCTWHGGGHRPSDGSAQASSLAFWASNSASVMTPCCLRSASLASSSAVLPEPAACLT